MAESRKKTLVVEVDAIALQVAIVAGLLGIKPPSGMPAKDAWDHIKGIAPDLATSSHQAAHNVMTLIAECVSKGSMQQ